MYSIRDFFVRCPGTAGRGHPCRGLRHSTVRGATMQTRHQATFPSAIGRHRSGAPMDDAFRAAPSTTPPFALPPGPSISTMDLPSTGTSHVERCLHLLPIRRSLLSHRPPRPVGVPQIPACVLLIFYAVFPPRARGRSSFSRIDAAMRALDQIRTLYRR